MRGAIDLGDHAVKTVIIKAGRPEGVTDADGNKSLPTAVYIGEDSKVLVGHDALDMRLSHPERVASNFKHLVGTETKALGDRTARGLMTILFGAAKAQAERQGGDTLDGVVLTVPVEFTDVQRDDAIEAGKAAGLTVLAVLNEPSAAAYSGIVRRRLINRDVLLLCIDIGSMTTDVSLISISNGVATVIFTVGVRFGGRNLRAVIEDLLLENLGKKVGKRIEKDKLTPEQRVELEQRAERAKIALNQQPSVRVSLPAGGKTQSVEISQSEYHAAAASILQEMLACADKALAAKGKSAAQMDSVILAGSSTFSPFLQDAFTKHLGVPCQTVGDASMTVAEGAALHAQSLSAGDRSISDGPFRESTTHDLGVAVIDETSPKRRAVCAVLVPKNTPIPCKPPEQRFRLERDNQTECVFEFYQGADGTDVKNCSFVGTARLTGLTPESSRSLRIGIAVNIGDTSVAEITVTDNISGKSERTSVRLSAAGRGSTGTGGQVP